MSQVTEVVDRDPTAVNRRFAWGERAEGLLAAAEGVGELQNYTGLGDIANQKVSLHEAQPIAFQLFKIPEFHLNSFSSHLDVASNQIDFLHL